MKNYFIILILFFTGLAGYAQEEGDDKGGKIRDRMNEYIQDRLGLSKERLKNFLLFFKIFPRIQTNSR